VTARQGTEIRLVVPGSRWSCHSCRAFIAGSNQTVTSASVTVRTPSSLSCVCTNSGRTSKPASASAGLSLRRRAAGS
jgi:hypothetical protein